MFFVGKISKIFVMYNFKYTAMKDIKFYPTIWQTIPFSLEMVNAWEKEENTKNKKTAPWFAKYIKVLKVSFT